MKKQHFVSCSAKIAVLQNGTNMRKVIYLMNCILLTVNVLLYIWFSIFTVLGTYSLGEYITADDIEIQLIAALIFEFIFFIISKIMSLKLKIDLSFKGKEILNFIPKAAVILFAIIAIALIIYSITVKIN